MTSSSGSIYVPSAICVYPQDIALCGFITSTTVHSVHNQWACSTAGYTLTNPCLSGWTGIQCTGIYVRSIVLSGVGMSGISRYQ